MHRYAGWFVVSGLLALAGCTSADDATTNEAPAADPSGETLGNAVLQRDTKMPVFIAAATKMTNENCPIKSYNLHDTKVLSQPKEVEGMAVYTRWKELWTVRGCDETVDVEVTYMQHFLDGVSIHAQ